MEYIKIFGVRIDKVTFKEAVEEVRGFLNGNKTKVIYTPNTEIVMLAKDNNNLKELLNEGDLVIADGIGLIHASKIKKKPLPERVTGFDMSIKLLEMANENRYGLFLLGGKEGVAELAAKNISDNYKDIKISGTNNGFFKGTHIGLTGHKEELEVIDKINALKTDILFVGLGAPKQEEWINENKSKLNCKVIIGNGGTIDILAGVGSRAPEIYQKLGLEWLYRLLKEPHRIKRQMVLPKFALKVIFSSKDIVK